MFSDLERLHARLNAPQSLAAVHALHAIHARGSARPVVSYEYETGPWLARLRKSFGSLRAAEDQCLLDWPRMTVVDERSVWQQTVDSALGNEFLAHFGNQAVFARPFRLLMQTYAGKIVTQSPENDLTLRIRHRDLKLQKRFLIWSNTLKKPEFGVSLTIRVRPETICVSFRPDFQT
jgi:hypothetical protein